jgi:hypothetical protein
MKKLISIVALASALALVGSKKNDEKAADPAPTVVDKGTLPATGAAPATGAEPATGAAPTPTDQAPPAAADTGVAECNEYLATFEKITTMCKDQLAAGYEPMKQARDLQAEQFKSWATLDETSKAATLQAAATTCKAADDGLKATVATLNCLK